MRVANETPGLRGETDPAGSRPAWVGAASVVGEGRGAGRGSEWSLAQRRLGSNL